MSENENPTNLEKMTSDEFLQHAQGLSVVEANIQETTRTIKRSKQSADARIQELEDANQKLKQAYIELFKKFMVSEENNKAMSEQIRQTAESVASEKASETTVVSDESIDTH